MPLSFMTLCQLKALKKVVSTQSTEVTYQKSSIPRPPPKIIFPEAWQVQRDEQFQRRSSIEKPVADEEKFKIDLRVQGVRQKASLSR